MTVGDRIRLTRENLGLSQDELAKKMGYTTRQTVSKAELYGDNITTTKVKKYADALGVSFEYLMGWSDSESQGREDALFLIQYHKLNPQNKAILKSTMMAMLAAQDSSI